MRAAGVGVEGMTGEKSCRQSKAQMIPLSKVYRQPEQQGVSVVPNALSQSQSIISKGCLSYLLFCKQVANH